MQADRVLAEKQLIVPSGQKSGSRFQHDNVEIEKPPESFAYFTKPTAGVNISPPIQDRFPEWAEFSPA
jgi:hypothetical protein